MADNDFFFICLQDLSPTKIEAKKQKEREKDEEARNRMNTYNIKLYFSGHLFRRLAKGPACIVCKKTEDVFRCSGSCCNLYHASCAGVKGPNPKPLSIVHTTGDDIAVKECVQENNNILQELTCMNCLDNKIQPCFVCNQTGGELIRCAEKYCGRRCGRCYHRHCLKEWPQNKFTEHGKLLCPYHVCQTCDSDDPRNRTREPDQKLIRCLECPASYHRITSCIPAGSELITDSAMICPRHRRYTKKPVHEKWCFLCSKGGALVCCEYCPITLHPECHKLEIGDKFICETCESGKLPLYGEIVWTKYSICKWWPAIIVPPWLIPETVLEKGQKNYFCVCFFGKQKQFGWLCRDNVYQFEEGDWEFNKQSKGDKDFCLALQEAKEFYNIIKKTTAIYKDPKQNTNSKPAAYRKILKNKVVPPVSFENIGDESSECDCTPNDPDPCGLNSDCLNRLVFMECSADCKAGDKCQNQRFEKRNYPQLEVRRAHSGWGLFAVEDIKKDDFIIEYVGEVINMEEFQRRFNKLADEKSELYYFFSLDSNLYIDAGPKGNDARFINHSCEPNCSPQKWTVNGIRRIGLFANVHIPAVSSFELLLLYTDLFTNPQTREINFPSANSESFRSSVS